MKCWMMSCVTAYAICTGLVFGQAPREAGNGPGPRPGPGQPGMPPPGGRFMPPEMGPERDIMWLGMFRPELQRRFINLRKSPAQYERVAAGVRERVQKVIMPMLDELEGEIRAAENEAGIQFDASQRPEGEGRSGGAGRAEQSPRPPRPDGEPSPGGPPGPRRGQRQDNQGPAGPRSDGAGPNGNRPDGPGADGPRPDGPGSGQRRQKFDGPGAGPRGGGGNSPADEPADRPKFGPPRPRPQVAPEEFERLREKNMELERKARELSGPGRSQPVDIEALRVVLNEQFEIRSQLRHMELERIAARVAELQELVAQLQRQQGQLENMREDLSNREKKRTEIIDRRIRELTDPARKPGDDRADDR